jgi:signal transduction histidine kinase
MKNPEPLVFSGRSLSAEVLALYRQARSGDDTDFKQWAMARARALVPMHSTSWVNGVMTEHGPLFHEARTEGLKPGYWEQFQSLGSVDPLGPRMFANPGRSFITGYADMPPAIVEHIMRAFEVRSAISGMAADGSTGTFSVVCWHRDPAMPEFTEVERSIHEQLLPHWVECLSLHRVGAVLRDLDATAIPGFLVALVEKTGLIHFAQTGFGALLADEFAGWSGTALPAAMVAAMVRGPSGFEGERVAATWRPAANNLWVVHARPRFGAPAPMARQVEAHLLSTTLAAREQQLDQATAALHEQQKQQAVALERQRIMRDLHDGVGAHLVGLLNLVNRQGADPSALEDAVTQALDEMRMAVDSLQPVHGDLATVLGTLRYRLQPRLQAAGIAVRWDVPDLPVLDTVSPADFLQLQRILMEAFTNVLKHARATEVAVRARCVGGRSPVVELQLVDDGVGLPPDGAARPGHGLKNMHLRATAIGAVLQVANVAPDAEAGRGTEVRLSWPVPPAAELAHDSGVAL